MNLHRRVFISVLALLLITGCTERRLYSEKQLVLGTVVEVISPYPEAADIVFKEIKRVEEVFSAFREDSALSHLNKSGFLNTNFEVTHLIDISKKFYELTNGQFDITIGPLTKIWKDAFGKNRLPSTKEIKKASKLVGFNKIYIDKKNHTIKFMEQGMQIDLGAIAKGYAVDAAIKELKRRGIDSAIVNAGGDIYCLGGKSGRPWRIGLQHPRDKSKIISTLEIKDMAVTTSGDYEQFIKIGNKRYSHIIDPNTGYPVDNNVISVTVVAKDATTADAVATCVFVLGKDRGIKIFKNYNGVKDIIVVTKSDVESIK